MSRRNGSPNYVEFQFDREVTLTLAEDRGRLSQNDYGEYFLRKFDDGRFTCANPDLERRLLDVGAKAGSAVSITKEKYGRSAVWVVKLMGSNMKPDPVKVQPIKANGHANGHAAAVDHAWRELPAEKYTAPNGNGSTPHTLEDQLKASIAQVHASAAESVKALDVPREPKNLLERCAVAAVDAALFVESYAAEHGRPLTVPVESIAAWASTLFINAH
jgi:hypothetical protein